MVDRVCPQLEMSGEMSKRREIVITTFMIAVFVLSLCSCGKQNDLQHQPAASQEVSLETAPSTEQDLDEALQEAAAADHRYAGVALNEETGWCYKVVREKDHSVSINEIYRFIGVNLRYRYNDDVKKVIWFEKERPDGSRSFYRAARYSGILVFGEDSEEGIADKELLDSIFSDCYSEKNQKYMMDPSQIPTKTLDKELFATARYKAYPQEYSGKYNDHLEYALEIEPNYEDRYRFQVAYMLEQGDIAEIWLDVLYRTGEGFRDYEQLSDLTKQGRANDGQQEAYELLQSVRMAVKSENSFIAGADSYKDKTIEGISFSRLYDILLSIEKNQDEKYDKYSENPVWIREEVSCEEYEAAYLAAHQEEKR